MKKLWMLPAVAVLVACGQTEEAKRTEDPSVMKTATEEVAEEQVRVYGKEIKPVGIISTEDLKAKLAEADTVECTFSGVIQETCVKKGCWMTMDAGLEEDMRVTFLDYGFFVPTEGQSGKKAVMRGKAYKSVTEVDLLKHYAEDAGKSQEEIDAITEPEIALSFEADGVLIYD